MSTEKRSQRITVPQLRARKGGEPIVCLTAYTTPMAQRLDPIVDLLLVGDSLGMVIYGFETTLPVTLEMMIGHGAAVRRGSQRACLRARQIAQAALAAAVRRTGAAVFPRRWGKARRAGTPLPPGSRRGARWPARRRCSPRTQCAPQTPAAGVSGTAAAVFPRRRGNAPRLPGAKGYFNAAALRAGAGPGRGRSARGQWAAALMGAARACPVSQSRSSQCRRPPPLRCFFRCFPSCDCCADMRHNVIFCLGRKRREARRVKRGIRRTGAP